MNELKTPAEESIEKCAFFPLEVREAIGHYLDTGFRWGMITKLINRKYATAYTSLQIQTLWEEENSTEDRTNEFSFQG